MQALCLRVVCARLPIKAFGAAPMMGPGVRCRDPARPRPGAHERFAKAERGVDLQRLANGAQPN